MHSETDTMTNTRENYATSEHKQSVNREAQIMEILELLKPESTDEQKFVALLLLPRILDPNDKKVVMNVFHSMDFTFLTRLLVTTSENEHIPPETLRAIAIHIIECFAEYEELLAQKQLTSRIQYMVKNISFR